MSLFRPDRRRVLQGLGATLLLPALGSRTWAAPAGRPAITDGVQAGDITGDRALIWSRTDKPARLLVEWDIQESFRSLRKVAGPITTAAQDYTARLDLSGLPADQRIFYRVRFEDVDTGALSETVTGQLRTAPTQRDDIRLGWRHRGAGLRHQPRYRWYAHLYRHA